MYITAVSRGSTSQTCALFSAAKKAEMHQSYYVLGAEHDRNKLSKAGFFMLCALGTADFSRVRLWCCGVSRCSSLRPPGFVHLMVLIHKTTQPAADRVV